MSLLATSLQRDTLRRAWGHLGLALGLLGIGLAALLLALWDRDRQSALRGEAENQLSALQAEREELEQSLSMLEGSIDRFRALQRGGFVGTGDRIAWTEALLRVNQRLGLPEIAFELSPQQALEPQAVDPALAGLEDAQPPPSGPMAHDLRIQMRGLHEGEWLALLDDLQAEQVGYFRTERCLLQRDQQAPGLELDCTLRWITYLPPAPVEPMPEDDEVTP